MPHMCQVTLPHGCVLTGRQCCAEVCVLGEVADRASSSSVACPRPSTIQVPKSIGGGGLNTLGWSSVSLRSWWLTLGEPGGLTFSPRLHHRVYWGNTSGSIPKSSGRESIRVLGQSASPPLLGEVGTPWAPAGCPSRANALWLILTCPESDLLLEV